MDEAERRPEAAPPVKARVGRLRSIPLFGKLDDADLERLCAQSDTIRLHAGERLFAEGDAGDRAYVITRGEIEIVKQSGGREVLLTLRKPDEVIGEMALLQAAPRSATAKARTDAELISIPKTEMDALLDTSAAAVRALFDVVLERWMSTQALVRQSEKMAQLGTLTAGLAHELNNPAGAIQGSVGQLRKAIERLGEVDRELYTTTADDLAHVEAVRDAFVGSLTRTTDLDPLERSDLEAEIEDLLTTAGVERAWELAADLTEAGAAHGLGDTIEAAGQHASVVIASGHARHLVASLLYEVEETSRRMAAIVRALKSYAYLDQAPVQDVDVRTGIEDTLMILKAKLKGTEPGQQIEVRREIDPDLPVIEAYGGELNQVWTNLIDNAIDAIRETGRPDGVIVVRVQHEGGRVAVEVEDNGAGVREGTRDRVFDPFFTTKPPGSGTGLGLNITYNIVVDRHRGSITVDSEPGRTVFRVELLERLDG